MLLQLLYQAALDPHRRIHTNKKDVFISTETKMTKVNQLHYTHVHQESNLCYWLAHFTTLLGNFLRKKRLCFLQSDLRLCATRRFERLAPRATWRLCNPATLHFAPSSLSPPLSSHPRLPPAHFTPPPHFTPLPLLSHTSLLSLSHVFSTSQTGFNLKQLL